MSDPIDMVRRSAPRVDDTSRLVRNVREDLMEKLTRLNGDEHADGDRPTADVPGSEESGTDVSEDDGLRPRWRWGRRRWVVPVATAAVVGLAGTAAASSLGIFSGGDTSTTTHVACAGEDAEVVADPSTGEEGISPLTIVDSVTGDPVADCEGVWRELHDTEPPLLVAYDNNNGGVVVVAQEVAVPSDHVALEPGVHQDTALIELESALDDYAQGLQSRCFDEEGARELVQGEFDRLGLTDWSVNVDESRPLDGPDTCAYFYLVSEQRAVELFGTGAVPEEAGADPYRGFARDLDDQLEAQCLDLEEAADVARTVAAETDVSDMTDVEFTEEAQLLNLNLVEDGSAECTRADVEVGGSVMVTLRGPSPD